MNNYICHVEHFRQNFIASEETIPTFDLAREVVEQDLK